jgi:hypothetical protein
MTWITDAIEQQRRDAEQAANRMSNVLAQKEKFNQQMPSAWDQIAEAIKGDVEQLNATGGRWVVECGPTMIQVHAENEIAALFTLEVDPTRGTLHYVCPVPAGQPGVPQNGKLQLRIGSGQAHIVGTKYPNGRGEIVTFKPEQVSQLLFAATLFPKNYPKF